MTEPHEQIKNGNVMRFVKDYWFLLVFIIGAAFAWAELRGRVDSNMKINDKQEISINNNQVSVAELNLKYASDVSVIKSQLSQLIKNNNK